MNFKAIVTWILRITAAIIMLQTLYFKFTGHEQSIKLFTEIGMEPYGRIGTGVMELIASILILIPITTSIGSLLGVGLMSGAIFFHLTKFRNIFDGDAVLFIYAVVVFVSCLALLIISKEQLLNFINIGQKLLQNKKNVFMILVCSVGFSNCSFSQKHNSMPEPKNKFYSKTDSTKLNIPNEEWKKELASDVYEIARKKGTERAFTGQYWDHKEVGTYHCKACGNPLFKSDGKFDSSCGWPSFFEPISESSVSYANDNTYGMKRVEVMCGRCDAHLGHIFDDGPPPTYKRYCINSVIIDFEKK